MIKPKNIIKIISYSDLRSFQTGWRHILNNQITAKKSVNMNIDFKALEKLEQSAQAAKDKGDVSSFLFRNAQWDDPFTNNMNECK